MMLKLCDINKQLDGNNTVGKTDVNNLQKTVKTYNFINMIIFVFRYVKL